MSNGKWRDPSVPKSGWTCVRVEDLGDLAEVCQMCEVEPIRFAHLLRHPTHAQLLTGCICAGQLTGDPTLARAMNVAARNRARRRATWIARPWRTSHRNPNNAVRKVKGTTITVFPQRGGFSYSIAVGGRVVFGGLYPSDADAKGAAFDRIWP